jgi:FixJ family two-component response regulator
MTTLHRVPTVLMTAQPEGRLRRQALHTGALAFLDKPFAENDLLRAVRTACSR